MVYKTTAAVVQEMLDDFEDITGVKLSPTNFGREEVIKMYPFAGAISALRADIQRVYDDTWPGSSTEEGLERHLEQRQLPDRIQPTSSVGSLTVPGTPGKVVPVGFQYKRNLDGKVFEAVAAVTIPIGGSIAQLYQSVQKGQSQNIDVSGQAFSAVTPEADINNTAVSASIFANGRNLETAEEMLSRIEDFDRNEDTGGNLAAYEQFAREADSSVVTATATKTPRGPTTVDTVITAGTADIRAAIENGDAVVRLPSASLVIAVQAFIIERNPVTDDHLTLTPTETAFDVTFDYTLFDESLRGAVDPIIEREIKIYIYSARSGARLKPTELERLIDQQVGHLICERRIANFNGATAHIDIPFGELYTPGTLDIGDFS